LIKQKYNELIRSPPKKPMVEKFFGQFGVQIKAYFKGPTSDNSVKILMGDGLTIGAVVNGLAQANARLIESKQKIER